MSTNFPTSLDNETVPAGSETLGGSTPPHRQVHENLKDAVQALEAKVGANSSAVATSHDYKLANGVVLKSLVDAKGDLLVGTANDAIARKVAGANDTLLIADSSQADGLRWATPAEVRTALTLVPGTDVEAHDADLTTIAGLTATTDNVMQAKAGVWASRTLAQLLSDLGLNPTKSVFHVPVLGPTTDQSATWTTAPIAGLVNGAFTAGAATDLNYGEWEATIPGGTYSMRVHYGKLSTAGKLQMSVDGVNVGGLTDQYSAALAAGVLDITGIAIGTAGKWSSAKVRASANGKNGSASGYTLLLCDIFLTKTA